MSTQLRIEKIVSGGQTGVDRAALDAALAAGLPIGGWCPHGRRAEDGVISDRYPLHETPSAEYAQRTRWNVRDSDGTLILTTGAESGGTSLTAEAASARDRPLLVVALDAPEVESSPVRRWILENEIRVLNVAGPRESEAPGIYERARRFLEALLRETPPAE